ncbi:MAG: leucyl aminopeptidase family protein [Phycisphaerae bacterium]|nr:leucyl aminopeptidase family protein [Phycisphaerae bacterium]
MFTSIQIVSRPPANAVLFGVFGDKGEAQPIDQATKSRAAALGVSASLAAAHARPETTGDAGSVTEVPGPLDKGAPQRVFLVGLGSRDAFNAGSLRGAAAAVGRRLAAGKVSGLSIELDGLCKAVKVNPGAAGSAFGEGIGLLGWVCDQFRGKATTQPKRTRLDLYAEHKDFTSGLSRGLGLASAANFTRTLSQTPPNVATPVWMAEQAKKLAKKHGLNCRVFEGKDLEREKFEGLINVGKASENKPCMIRLEYTPERPSRKKPLVLIGKTMTYDSGGLSLKINNGMVGMKRDKDGGCAVLGAMQAIAAVIKPRVRIVALLAVAENSISDEAYRPDDVLTFRNGVTVEITNTDAEGRLVLADALCWACEKEEPASVIDLATLTGGVVVALGSTFAGMFCEDDALRKKVEAAAAASGERVWRLPMHAEYREMMKSPIADILNSNPNRKAHPIQGAAFLSYFVEEGVPWCHLDIAGVHAVEKNAGPFIEGPTGWGARLLAELADAE